MQDPKREVELLLVKHRRQRQIKRRLLHRKKYHQIVSEQPVKNTPEKPEGIFVSIPSYRDPDTANTVKDLFEKAEFPERLWVSVYEQNASGDPNCQELLADHKWVEHIITLVAPSHDATGPMTARAQIEIKCLPLVRDRVKYILQIDAHMRFRKDWDTDLIKQLEACPSSKPILSAYPVNFHTPPRGKAEIKWGRLLPTFIFFTDFHAKLGLPEFKSQTFHKAPTSPVPTAYWAAGFSFAPIELVEEVPYCSNYDYVFLGEEFSRAMMYYTHGWDIFVPSVMLLCHKWDRSGRPLFWEQIYQPNCVVDEETRQERKWAEKDAYAQLHDLLKTGQNNYEKCGTSRTLSQWRDWCGINVSEAKYLERAKWGLTTQEKEEAILKWGNAISLD